ncbi:EG45-like domain containing protein [Rhynchospora pubera]|uniref:EG45-like domain containing protein n=1 Tax=Rhynchospora pubera TaxID=906938 RepID=A0AAV8DQM4_9POAL|nr:EG45-like domain containing protein [Rhynchospora pubera]
MWSLLSFQSLHLLLSLLLSLLFLTSADLGTASSYGPPYLPTACHGADQGQFPPDDLFAAAGDAIWDNGASCGRQYLVRCLSSITPGACIAGQRVQVTIVDHATTLNSMPSKNSTTLVLAERAFVNIAKLSAASINIEFTQV